MVDANFPIGGGLGAPTHHGMVNHANVRDKLGRQLGIELEDQEKMQIYPKPFFVPCLKRREVLRRL